MNPQTTPAARFRRLYQGAGPNDCWHWLGSKDRKGYGHFWHGGNVRAHRFSYELHVGPIPDGMTLDHGCRTRDCVNFRHVRPMPLVENVMLGQSPPARKARMKRCANNHLFDRIGTRRDGRTFRRCSRCIEAYNRTRRA